MHQNISKVFYCKNNRWVVRTDNSNIGMGHENSRFNRKHKRFVVDGGSFESISVIGPILDQNECHCKWGQWQSWSSCTTSCLGIGGIQTRRRTLYHDSRSECFRADACSYSHLDNQSIVCNSMCYPDGTILIGGNYPNIQIYRQLPCSCPRGTIGTPGACCQCI
ncbi:hypothetical protein DPMN_165517 [Dreissena polymorpha]|uniref:Uncharacterized protein n=1 Tax=Dreissena polymorpha TaxID=45954 RepID=A0A9D4EXR8_DREPO|nr:hypothetical protein DPMN_165517 [Dreissena polymorpha]